MKIFGKEFLTKNDLKNTVAALEQELCTMKEAFPFELGQEVFDIQLRDETGKYTKKNASLEHSRINPVTVGESNYFSLVKRYKENDVFSDLKDATEFLNTVCAKKAE